MWVWAPPGGHPTRHCTSTHRCADSAQRQQPGLAQHSTGAHGVAAGGPHGRAKHRQRAPSRRVGRGTHLYVASRPFPAANPTTKQDTAACPAEHTRLSQHSAGAGGSRAGHVLPTWFVVDMAQHAQHSTRVMTPSCWAAAPQAKAGHHPTDAPPASAAARSSPRVSTDCGEHLAMGMHPTNRRSALSRRVQCMHAKRGRAHTALRHAATPCLACPHSKARRRHHQDPTPASPTKEKGFSQTAAPACRTVVGKTDDAAPPEAHHAHADGKSSKQIVQQRIEEAHMGQPT
jgi:hypothetical protein